jgi:hypothetical protein
MPPRWRHVNHIRALLGILFMGLDPSRVMRDRIAAIALGRDHRFNASGRDLLADGVGIVAAIGQECLDPLADHSEQGPKALHIMRLAGRQHEAEREAPRVASGVQLGGEASARSAESLGLLSPLFMPTAQ